MKTNQLFLLFLFFIGIFSYSQVGIGTQTPRGALDINSPTTNTSGLVLPTNHATTNIVNPQGGTVAEGTVIYDSTQRCVKFFNGTSWSNCLCDSCGATSPSLELNCSLNGFTGTYASGVAINSTNTFTVTVSNNTIFQAGPISIQASDLVLSGVSGVTVSSVSHSSITLNPGQSQQITYFLTGTPTADGTLSATFSKLNQTCSNNVQVTKTIRFGYEGINPIGSPSHTAGYNQQLTDVNNYGPSGTYVTNRPFIFSEFSLDATTEDLRQRYDILSVSAQSFNNNPTRVQKIKDFVANGGVVFITIENLRHAGSGTQEYVFNQFGNTGTIANNNNVFYEGDASSTESFSNVFGNTLGVVIKGADNARINQSQLAIGSRVFATIRMDTPRDVLFWTSEGPYDGRVIWAVDVDLFNINSNNISGSIDTDQERFLHNIMAYALGKAGI